MALIKPGKDTCSWVAEGHVCYDKVFGLYPEGHKEPNICVYIHIYIHKINVFLTLSSNNVKDRLKEGLGGGRA